MVLADEVSRATAWLRAGTSVAVVGPRGTGRTTVARAVVAGLERAGITVLEIPGDRLGTPSPYRSLAALDIGRGASGTVVDALTRHLAGPETVVVVDDAAWLDPESAAALGSAVRRAGVPVLATRTGARTEAADVHRWFPTSDPSQLVLAPFTYEQTSELVHALLDGPIEPDLIASVHAKSSGILSAIGALVRTGLRSGAIARTDGVWELVRSDLWNEHLAVVVEHLLSEVGPQDLRAAYALAMLGSMTMDQVTAAGLDRAMARLEDRGLVALTGGHHAGVQLTLRPLMILDYFRDRLPDATGVLIARRLSAALGIPVAEILRRAAPGLDLPVLGDVAAPRDLEYSTQARVFDDGLARERSRRATRWAAQPTAATALDYVTLLWETADWQDEALRVLDGTDRLLGAETADALVSYTFLKAYVHALLRRSPREAAQALHWLGAQSPVLRVDAAAIGLFLRAISSRVHARDIARARELAGAASSTSWMTRFALLALLALHADPEAVDVGDPPESTPGTLTPAWRFFQVLALVEADRTDEALAIAREQLAEARTTFDRPRIYLFTYTVAHVLFRAGGWSEANALISESLVLGSPREGAPGRPSYEALLRMGALLLFLGGHRRAAGSLLHGVAEGPDGPTTWLRHSTSDAVRAIIDADGIGAADHLSRGAADGGARGYHAMERLGFLYALWLDPAMDRLERLDAVCERPGRPVRHVPFRRFLRAAMTDPAGIVAAAQTYGPPEDLPLAVLVSRRLADRAPDATTRAETERAAELLADRLGRDVAVGARAAPDPALLLTEREFEVALLAGARSNTQIAADLHLSRRTVENHVHRALKKTGVQTREDLTLVVGRSRRQR